MVVMNEEAGRLDTMDFCNALGITKEFSRNVWRNQGSVEKPWLLTIHPTVVLDRSRFWKSVGIRTLLIWGVLYGMKCCLFMAS